MKGQIEKLIKKYEDKIKMYEKSIEELTFEQCQHLLYKKGELIEVIKDLKNII